MLGGTELEPSVKAKYASLMRVERVRGRNREVEMPSMAALSGRARHVGLTQVKSKATVGLHAKADV